MTVGERIIKTMHDKDITYRDLEQATGIAKSALHRYVTGQTNKLPLDRLELIAKALGVTPAYLMGWEDEDNANNLVGERIRHLRKREGLSQEELAIALKTTKQTIYKYEQGIVTNIPSDKIELLADALNTTPAYLMGWEDASTINEDKAIGKIIKRKRIENGLTLLEVANKLGVEEATMQRYESGKIKNIKHETIVALAEIFSCSPAYLMGWEDDAAQKETPAKSRRKGVKIPVLGTVVAGVPIEAIEDILDYEEIGEELASQGEFFALRVKGDSMEPLLYEGDIVIIRMQSDADNGDIVVALIDNETTIKRLKKVDGGVMFIPANAKYEPLFFSGKGVKEVAIIGKAVELRRGL